MEPLVESINNILFFDDIPKIGSPVVKSRTVLDERGNEWLVYCQVSPSMREIKCKRYYKIVDPACKPYWTHICEYPELYPLLSKGTDSLTGEVPLGEVRELLAIFSGVILPRDNKKLGRIVNIFTKH